MPDSCKFCTNCGTKLQVTSPNITNATYDTDNKDCASEKNIYSKNIISKRMKTII